MSKLKILREQQHLTQEELSEQSGISVRTIQRIEAGTIPKGHTLKILSKTLHVDESVLLPEKETKSNEETKPINYTFIKLINLSSLLFIILPPLNIFAPLVLRSILKQKNPITNQIVSIQILWSILAPIIFMLVILMKLGNKATLITIIVLLLSNVFIILRNTAEIDRNKKLYILLNFNII